jgi:hypothetical protein
MVSALSFFSPNFRLSGASFNGFFMAKFEKFAEANSDLDGRPLGKRVSERE